MDLKGLGKVLKRTLVRGASDNTTEILTNYLSELIAAKSRVYDTPTVIQLEVLLETLIKLIKKKDPRAESIIVMLLQLLDDDFVIYAFEFSSKLFIRDPSPGRIRNLFKFLRNTGVAFKPRHVAIAVKLYPILARTLDDLISLALRHFPAERLYLWTNNWYGLSLKIFHRSEEKEMMREKVGRLYQEMKRIPPVGLSYIFDIELTNYFPFQRKVVDDQGNSLIG